MNALANDQMKRLRRLLADVPDITFGRYTGDTEDDPQRGRGGLRASSTPASRPAAQRAAQPRGDARDAAAPAAHQLRDARVPAAPSPDMELFEGERRRALAVHRRRRGPRLRRQRRARSWRCCCAGCATGSPPDRPVQCIATSATVGGDTTGRRRLRRAPCSASPVRVDPARPGPAGPRHRRAGRPAGRTRCGARCRRRPTPSCSTHRTRPAPSGRARREHGYGTDDAAQALRPRATRTSAPETRWPTGRCRCVKRPRPCSPTASEPALGGAGGPGERHSTTSDGAPVLSARYHLFVRATEGAFTCLGPNGPHVSLTRTRAVRALRRRGLRIRHLPSLRHRLPAPARSSRVGSHSVFRSRRSRDEQQVWLALVDAGRPPTRTRRAAGSAAPSAGELGALCPRCGVVPAGPATNCPAAPIVPHAGRCVSCVNALTSSPRCLACGARGAGADPAASRAATRPPPRSSRPPSTRSCPWHPTRSSKACEGAGASCCCSATAGSRPRTSRPTSRTPTSGCSADG